MAMARFAEGEAFAEADPARASAALHEARRQAYEIGTGSSPAPPWPRWWPCGQHGPPEEALAPFRDAIDHWRTSRNRRLLVTTLRNLVVLLARTGRDEAADDACASSNRVLEAPDLRQTPATGPLGTRSARAPAGP